MADCLEINAFLPRPWQWLKNPNNYLNIFYYMEKSANAIMLIEVLILC